MIPRGRVVVYDTDGVNPYGRELAAILGSAGFEVTLFYATSAMWTPSHIPDSRPLVASSRQMDGTVRHLISRLITPLRAVQMAKRSGCPLVVAWTRDGWDATLFGLVAHRLKGLVFVNHNPANIRRRPGLAGRAESWLKRRATVTVIHSARITCDSEDDPDRISLAPHPPYTAWAQAHRALLSAPRREPRQPTVAFLGALRPDKGIDEFIDVVAQMRTPELNVKFLGRGTLSADQERKLNERGVRFNDPCSRFLEDSELASSLPEVDLVLAPYRQVTQSGSVHLALTCGVGVLAYPLGGLPDILGARSLVSVGNTLAMANRADEYLRSPWACAKETDEELIGKCERAWRTILHELGSKVRPAAERGSR